MNSTANTLIKRLWLPVMTLMAITGMGQMPIFKRYYVADIPGLGWLAEPYTVHWVHYMGAAVFMFMVAWQCSLWIMARLSTQRLANHSVRQADGNSVLAASRVTASGAIRITLIALIVITGYLRVLKNLPDFYWSPLFTMLVDWAHLSFAVMLGGVSLWAATTGKKAYTTQHLIKTTS